MDGQNGGGSKHGGWTKHGGRRALPQSRPLPFPKAAEIELPAAASMSSEELRASLSDLSVGSRSPTASQIGSSVDPSSEGGTQVTCFTEDLHDVTLHFQIIRLSKQICAWIGCNSAKFGHLYVAASTRPGDGVSVTSILGGTSDNTESSMARRLVLKTGLNIVLACNIPKDSPMLEAAAEKKLVEKLRSLGYIRSKSAEANTSTAV